MGRDMVLKPGCRHLDTSRISERNNVRDVLLVKGGKSEPGGTITEIIELTDSMGLPVIRRETALDSDRLGQQRTVSVVEAHDLSPVAYEAHLSTMDVSARYQNGRVTGVRKRGSHTQIGSGLEIPRDAFDIGSIELILRAVDLSAGWSGMFNVADPVGGRVTRGRFVVTGEQNLSGVDCWLVASLIDDARVDYAVGQDTPEIVRQSFSPRKGLTVEFV